MCINTMQPSNKHKLHGYVIELEQDQITRCKLSSSISHSQVPKSNCHLKDLKKILQSPFVIKTKI